MCVKCGENLRVFDCELKGRCSADRMAFCVDPVRVYGQALPAAGIRDTKPAVFYIVNYFSYCVMKPGNRPALPGADAPDFPPEPVPLHIRWPWHIPPIFKRDEQKGIVALIFIPRIAFYFVDRSAP